MLLLSLAFPAAAVRAEDTRWAAAATTNTVVHPSGDLTLASDASPAAPAYGDFARFGLFDSQPQTTAPTRRVLVSWAATIPAGAAVRVDIRRGNGQRWSDWSLDVRSGDVVDLGGAGTRLQYRVVLLANAAAPRVQFVALEPQPLSAAEAERSAQEEPIAPTYHIRATRMGLVGDRTANGHIIEPNDWFVSLPSFRSLSSKGGSEYMARLSYHGKSVVVPVWEVGPWNIHDDYWNVDRERFADLPVGWPEDHAAYFDGYNGGRAEKGRVRFPTAADVGDGAWVALGIPFRDEQEELDITFLWQGQDPGANPDPVAPGGAPPAPPEDPAGTISVDDLNGGFSRNDAAWYEFSCGRGNHAFWTYSTPKRADSTNLGAWSASLTAGTYDVSVYVPNCRNGKKDTTSAHYEVSHAGGSTTVVVNQAANAGSWVSLGSFEFGETGQVSLSDLTDDSMRSVWFDAVRWTAR
jgi:hypothetical protein